MKNKPRMKDAPRRKDEPTALEKKVMAGGRLTLEEARAKIDYYFKHVWV